MHDAGPIVWVILVVIGVVSSIASNARRRAGTAGSPLTNVPARQQFAAPPQPARAAPLAPPQPSRQPAASTPRVRHLSPPVSAAGADVPAQDRPFAFPQPPRRKAGAFSGRRALVRGVVAAEVLGKPLALRDEV